MLKTYAVILASGTGSRCKSDIPKQFLKLDNKTILELTLEKFENSNVIDYIVLVITPEYIEKATSIIRNNNYKKIIKIVPGGETRKDSSFIGISQINEKEAKVLIHDCARPFVSDKTIEDCVNLLDSVDALEVAIPSTDTILEINNNLIKNIPPRKTLMQAQTPQAFKLTTIKKAHELSKDDNVFTDDGGMVLKHNIADVHIVVGNIENIKITYPKDLEIAKQILKDLRS